MLLTKVVRNMSRTALFVFLSISFTFTATSLSGCEKKGVIGEIVQEAPITALVFETGNDGGETGFGVVYRKVNDISLLMAQENKPVLVAFFDGRALSNAAIPFLEQLTDQFSSSALIIRVNVELDDNTKEVEELKTLFKVSDYPWFAVAYKGQLQSSISGYSDAAQADIVKMIRDASE